MLGSSKIVRSGISLISLEISRCANWADFEVFGVRNVVSGVRGVRGVRGARGAPGIRFPRLSGTGRLERPVYGDRTGVFSLLVGIGIFLAAFTD